MFSVGKLHEPVGRKSHRTNVILASNKVPSANLRNEFSSVVDSCQTMHLFYLIHELARRWMKDEENE